MSFQTAQPLTHSGLSLTNRPVDFFVHTHAKGRLTLDPPYQRGNVWTNDQKVSLIYSWLTGTPIPAVVMNDRRGAGWRSADRAMYAVIDGKQRIQTAIDWFAGKLAIPASWLPASHVSRTHEIYDGPYVTFNDLTDAGQRTTENFTLPCAEGQLPSLRAEAELFLLVNGGGTPQTETDLQRATRLIRD